MIDLFGVGASRVRWALGANEHRARVLLVAILDEILRLSLAASAVPVLVYLPVLTELVDVSPGLSENERFLDRFCRDRHAHCLFLRQRFAVGTRGDPALSTSRHWSRVAHRIAADGIKDYLLTEDLIHPER